MRHLAAATRLEPPKPPPLKHWGLRPMTRAHLALGARPEASRQARAALERAASAWQALLPEPLEIRARLLDSALTPKDALSEQSAFALLEISTLPARALLEMDLPLVLEILRLLS